MAGRFRGAIAFGVLTAGVWFVGGADTAGACSCIAPEGPPPHDVDATALDVAPAEFGSMWTFRVDEVHVGELGITDEIGVIVDTGEGSSCATGQQPPDVGSRYRLALEAPEPGGPFHINFCTGSFELIAADGEPPAIEADDDSRPYGLYIVGGLAAVTVIGAGVAFATGRRAPSS